MSEHLLKNKILSNNFSFDKKYFYVHKFVKNIFSLLIINKTTEKSYLLVKTLTSKIKIVLKFQENSSIISGSVSQPGAALLPPLPRTFLTQSVSLAPLSAHSINKKQLVPNISQSISTATSALNLSHDFDRSINIKRSKHQRQLTPGSIIIQVVN